MSQKRSIVCVTLLACNASEYFTQDIEDYVQAEYVEEVKQPEPAKQVESSLHKMVNAQLEVLGADPLGPEPTNTDPLKALWPIDAKVGYDLACTVVDKNGKRYVDTPADKIDYVMNSLTARLKKADLDPATRDMTHMKLDILEIMAKI